MKVLALETSTQTGSVALLSDGAVLGELTLSVSLQHSERLMPAIHRLLNEACVSVPDLDLVAVACGPGSFTGLRVGIAAAQGLAAAAGLPLTGVSSLAGLAVNGSFFEGLVMPTFNAFRGEVYYGLYRTTGAVPEAVVAEGVLDPAGLVQELKDRGEKLLVLGDGAPVLLEKLQEASGRLDWRLAPAPLMMPRAANIACLALHAGSSDAPVVPVYLRKAG